MSDLRSNWMSIRYNPNNRLITLQNGIRQK